MQTPNQVGWPDSPQMIEIWNPWSSGLLAQAPRMTKKSSCWSSRLPAQSPGDWNFELLMKSGARAAASECENCKLLINSAATAAPHLMEISSSWPRRLLVQRQRNQKSKLHIKLVSSAAPKWLTFRASDQVLLAQPPWTMKISNSCSSRLPGQHQDDRRWHAS